MFKKVDPQRIGMIGHSMGGFGVLNLATRCSFVDKYEVAAAVAVMPATESIFYINPKKIKIPVFFVTGTGDTVIDSQQAVTAFNEDPLIDKMLANGVGLTHDDIGFHGSQALNSYMA